MSEKFIYKRNDRIKKDLEKFKNQILNDRPNRVTIQSDFLLEVIFLIDNLTQEMQEYYFRNVKDKQLIILQKIMMEGQKNKLNKIKEITIPTPENPTSIKFQMCEEYKKILEVLEDE